MTLEDLLREIGVKNRQYHWLDEVITNIDWNEHLGLSRVTFKTDQPLILDGDGGYFRDVGFIIWLPRKRTEQLLSEAREGKTK